MWYRTANTAGTSVFDTYNAGGGIGTNNNQQGAVTRYIPPMQSYWVFVTAGNPTGSISFGNAQRSHYQTGVQGLRSTAQDFPMFLRLNVKQGSSVDQAILYLKQEATAAFDVYDSEKMFAPGIPQLYTQVSGKKLVINGMKNNKKQQIIPLYIDAPTTGIFTFEVEEFNNEDGLILLEDKQEGIIQDLTINGVYTFYANSGTIANRFYIHFLQPDLTITAQGPVSSWVEEAAVINEGGSILVSSNGRGKVTVMQDIDESSTQKGSVVVRDATGRLVYEGSLLSTTMTIDLEEPSGIYFVEVQFSGQVEVQKIMIY
jgi:hypothetical protein